MSSHSTVEFESSVVLARRTRCHILALLLASICLAASGCSWIMVQQPDANYTVEEADAPPACTTSLGPAIGDTWDTIAVGGGLIAAGILTPIVTDLDAQWGVAQAGAGLGLGAMFGASALYGYRSTRRCRDLRQQYFRHLDSRVRSLN